MIPKLNKLHRIFIIQSIVLFLFALLLLIPAPLFQLRNTHISTTNVVDVTYLTARYGFWKGFQQFIHLVPPSTFKTILLQTFVDLIPVDHWWDHIYSLKQPAAVQLAQIYTNQQNWSQLQNLTDDFLQTDSRDANWWYLNGLSLEHQNQLANAIESYYQALTIESTHLETIHHLVDLFILQGKYHSADQILDRFQTLTGLPKLPDMLINQQNLIHEKTNL